MRWIVIAAAIFGASSVVIGAMLSHMAGDMDTEILQTALRYHQMHSIVLLALGLYALNKQPAKSVMISTSLFIAGILVFSGSLYAMALFNVPALGQITPLGGLCLISAWLSLILITNKTHAQPFE